MMNIFKVFLLMAMVLSMLLSTELAAKSEIIAHRAASGYLPEHSLEAVALAHSLGADYIEQDLVLTKDLIPVVLHDIHLDTVTNVAEKFPKRHRKDGRFYAFDFTLAELKTLRMHERKTLNGEQVYNKRYQGNAAFTIATFAEEIELIGQLNRQFNKNVGLYPEIKSPAWHKAQGADISQIVLSMLRDYQLDDADKAIYIQCFDFAETQRLRNELGAKVKLIQLLAENEWQESESDYNYLRTADGLKEIAKVAQGIGPWIPQLVDIKTKKPTTLITHAHNAGLLVHPYTYRIDDLAKGFTQVELLDTLFKQIKVDGVFTDFPDVVVQYLNKTKSENN